MPLLIYRISTFKVLIMIDPIDFLELKDVKLFFKCDVLKEAVVFFDSDSWGLYFSVVKDQNIHIKTQRGEPRRYKTITAAIKVAHEVGFQQIKILINVDPSHW